MTIKSSVSLTDDQYAFARALVASGNFPSVSAVLQQGVELLRQRIEKETLETEALRVLLERRRGGDFVSSTEMEARLEDLVAAKRRAHSIQD